MKRYFASSLAVLSVALFAFAQEGRTQKADDHPGHHGTKLTKSLVHCLTECTFCALHSAKLIGEGKKDHLTTMQLCEECADVCYVTLKLAANKSKALSSQADACAKMCDTCGEACEKHPNDDMMKQCAKACRDCAKACRDMTVATTR